MPALDRDAQDLRIALWEMFWCVYWVEAKMIDGDLIRHHGLISAEEWRRKIDRIVDSSR